MANEATRVEGPYDVHDFTCFDNQPIEKGTILWYSGTNNVSGIAIDAADGKAIAGIAVAEKVASDGALTISVATNGFWQCKNDAGSAIIAGDMVSLSGQNLLATHLLPSLSGNVLGKAMEDIAASAWGTIKLTC